MVESKMGRTAGAGCLVLFALPFAGTSVFMSWMLCSMLWLNHEAASWESVPAEISHLELKSYQNDGSTTYKVVADYRYSYQGNEYTADRVGLSSSGDSMKSYHRKLHDRLERAQKEGNARCFCDPDDPSQALLDRTLRISSVLFMAPFILAFGGVGFGMLFGAVYASRKMTATAKLQAADPDKPWLWREDWKQGVLKSSASKSMWALAGFAFFWNSISFPIAGIFLLDDEAKPWWVMLILSLFPLIGVGMVVAFFYQWIRSRKYGSSTFRLGHVPGVIGGRFSGVVMAPAIVGDSEKINTKLVCAQTVKSEDSSREKVLWQDERTLSETLSADEPGRIGIPIVFTIPSDKKATDESESISWKLTVHAPCKGIDYKEEFEVPVFLTEDSQDGVMPDEKPLTKYEIETPLAQLLADQRIMAEELTVRDGIRYVSPAARYKLSATIVSAFAIGFSVACYYVWHHGPWFIAVILGLIGLILFFCSVSSWLGRSELRIEGEQWHARSSWYGWLGAGVQFQTTDIEEIRSESRMSTGEGSSQTVWNEVSATLRSKPGEGGGKKITLVRYVLGGAAERKLLADLRHRAGLAQDANAPADENPSDLDFDDIPT